MKRRNWMGFAKKQVERGKLHTSPGLLRKIAERARAAAGEARAAKKRAREKEDEANRYFRELKSAHGKGYRWPGTKREKSGRSSGKSLSDLLYGRNPKMAKKRKRRNRKGKMPAGLAAYWRKKRRAKNGRKRRTKQRKGITVAMRKRAYRLLRRAVARNKVRNYRKRRTVKRRRRSAPRISSRVHRITLPAMSPSATKRVVAAIRRVAGNRRVRVK